MAPLNNFILWEFRAHETELLIYVFNVLLRCDLIKEEKIDSFDSILGSISNLFKTFLLLPFHYSLLPTHRLTVINITI